LPSKPCKEVKIQSINEITGAEDVDIDPQNRIYGGTGDGKIMRLWPDGRVEIFAETGGRPLGLHFDRSGNLIVCDAYKGLISIFGMMLWIRSTRIHF